SSAFPKKQAGPPEARLYRTARAGHARCGHLLDDNAGVLSGRLYAPLARSDCPGRHRRSLAGHLRARIAGNAAAGGKRSEYGPSQSDMRSEEEKPRHDHERSDWNLNYVVWGAITLVIAVTVMCTASWWIFRTFQSWAESRVLGTALA